MKVILTEDVEKLGGGSEIVEVADGYARNYLLPRSLAVPATKSALANIENMRRIADRRQAHLKSGAEEVAAKLQGKTVVMPAKVGSGGRLYGSISSADIAQQLQKDFGVQLDKKQVDLSEPLRSAGLHAVVLNLHRDIKPSITVQIGEAPAGGWPQSEASAAEAVPAETAEVAA